MAIGVATVVVVSDFRTSFDNSTFLWWTSVPQEIIQTRNLKAFCVNSRMYFRGKSRSVRHNFSDDQFFFGYCCRRKYIELYYLITSTNWKQLERVFADETNFHICHSMIFKCAAIVRAQSEQTTKTTHLIILIRFWLKNYLDWIWRRIKIFLCWTLLCWWNSSIFVFSYAALEAARVRCRSNAPTHKRHKHSYTHTEIHNAPI